MKSKPDIDHEFFARHIMATLPAEMQARKKILATLAVMLPRPYSLRWNLLKVLETLRSHEKAQLDFVQLLDKGSGNQPKTAGGEK